MKLLISPAKKMREDGDFLAPRQAPALLERAAVLAEWLRGLDYTALKKLLACNDGIAELNFRRFQEMDLRRPGTPALLSYDGIQYQYMAPGVLESQALDYLQTHLRMPRHTCASSPAFTGCCAPSTACSPTGWRWGPDAAPPSAKASTTSGAIPCTGR